MNLFLRRFLSAPLPRKINSGSLLMSAADGIIRRQQGCAKGKQTLLRPSTCPPWTDVTQWLVVTLSGRCCRDPPGRICLFGMNKSVCVCKKKRKVRPILCHYSKTKYICNTLLVIEGVFFTNNSPGLF